MLAETNRTPFDLSAAEAELVAGYNVDYSALLFAVFFLGKYCSMLLSSVLFCIPFLGEGAAAPRPAMPWFLAWKRPSSGGFLVAVCAALPRHRYGQRADISWKTFLLATGGFIIFVAGPVVAFSAAPIVYKFLQLDFFVV